MSASQFGDRVVPDPDERRITADRASVVVCTFSSRRLQQAVACVESVLAQSPPPAQVIVVVDHNEDLRAMLRARLGDRVEIVVNHGKPGLSSARNTAVGRSSGDAVVFIDDDAVAHDRWLARLLTAFDDPAVIGAGGHAHPAWEGETPRWLPDEFLWAVGCSYRGLPASGPVRNPLGCNMAFRTEVFDRVGLFDPRIGRLGSHPVGCEETEFCIRAARAMAASRIVMVSGADVDHRVPPDRARPGYVVRRCYHEGISKAIVRAVGDARSLETERVYVRRTLPARIWGSSRQLLVGPARLDALGQIGVVVAGTLAAGAGFAAATVSLALRHTSRRLRASALQAMPRRSIR
jgi:GT2 family glycosyltransferase